MSIPSFITDRLAELLEADHYENLDRQVDAYAHLACQALNAGDDDAAREWAAGYRLGVETIHEFFVRRDARKQQRLSAGS